MNHRRLENLILNGGSMFSRLSHYIYIAKVVTFLEEKEELLIFQQIIRLAANNMLQIETEQADGTIVKHTRPYIMDLGSTNKTFVNDSPIEPQRYYELREQDTIKFGNSR
ncbi:hypothetical protein TSUD_130850 [Trifolium subterraneum]|nr:hypothetical protein TSUD_130850 [Trifolium subterraneum]